MDIPNNSRVTGSINDITEGNINADLQRFGSFGNGVQPVMLCRALHEQKAAVCKFNVESQ